MLQISTRYKPPPRVKVLKETLASLKVDFNRRKEIKLPRLFSVEAEFHGALILAECQYVESLIRDIQGDSDGLKSTWIEVRKVSPAVSQKSKKTIKK